MKKVSEIEATKSFYDQNFAHWVQKKTDSFFHEKQFTKMVSLWPQRGTILDIGCAHGTHVPLFLGIGRHLSYVGIDISSVFIKIAKRRYPQLDFSIADIANEKELPSKKFSGFIAISVLMHVPFELWDTMFTNIEKRMKPGSYGYVVLPTTHPSGHMKTESDTRHFTILSKTEQKKYFKTRGWKIVSTGTTDGFTVKSAWQWYIVQLP